MGWKTESQNALDVSISIMGTSFTYNSVSYMGIFDEINQSLDLEFGGYDNRKTYSLIVSKTDFNARPLINSKVQLSGRTYRVRDQLIEDDISYTLTLVDHA